MSYEPLVVYLGNINTRRKVTSGSLEYYYFDIYPPVEIPKYPSGSSEVGLDIFGQEGSQSVLVFFEPTHEDLFFRNDYEALENNDKSSRISKKLLKVDRDASQLQPTNFQIILNSLGTGRKAFLEDEFFAEVQDSNYESLAWSNSRYNGTQYSAIVQGIDPVLYLVGFSGVTFNSGSTKETIRELYSTLPTEQIYFFTPATGSNNGLFYNINYDDIVLNKSILFTFENKNTITTAYNLKILDTNNGSIYSTDINGVVKLTETIDI